MKSFCFKIAKLMVTGFAASACSVVSAQSVDQAGEISSISAINLSDHDIAASASDHPTVDTKAICIARKQCGPTRYFQAEAMFLSRRYDAAPVLFGLGRASGQFSNAEWESTSISSNSNVDDGEFEFIDWGIQGDSFGSSTFLDGNFGQADQLTGIPRLTFGIISENGVGIQGRYWRMENSIGSFGLPVDFSNVPPYPNFTADDEWEDGALNRVAGFEHFAAETIDMELSKDFCTFGWHGLATFGVRHGSYDNYRINAVDGGIQTGVSGVTAPLGTNDNLLNTFHTADYDLGSRQAASFRGTGLTTSLTGMRPFAFNPQFALFASMRGSVLYGDSVNVAQTYAAMDSFYNSDFASDSQTLRDSNEMYIAELQLGSQWSRNVNFLNGRVFARAAVEYQFWRNNAAQANAESVAGDLGITRPITSFSGDAGGIGRTQGTSVARGLEQEFDMIGASFSAGFAF
jgi:hypothetical protein